MDKKDITWILAAFCIILVVAFVIKPIATGQPVNTGLSFADTGTIRDGHPPCGIRKYYHDPDNNPTHNSNHNPAYPGADLERQGADRRVC